MARYIEIRGLLTACALLALAGQVGAGNQDNALHPLNPPISAPAFELLDLNGQTHTLADYLGQPLVVNFWATWCPPCRAEMPSMNRAWHKIKDDGVKLIAINVGEDYEAVFAFSADIEVDFPLLLDQKNTVFNTWPVQGLPTTFVLNPQGQIVYKATGEREWDEPGLLEQIKALR